MDSKKPNRFPLIRAEYYLIITLIFSVLTMRFNLIFGIVEFFIFSFMLVLILINKNKKSDEVKSYIYDLMFKVDNITKESLLKIPFAMCIVKKNGVIAWFNEQFLNLVENMDIYDANIGDVFNNSDFEKLQSGEISYLKGLFYNGRYYDVRCNETSEDMDSKNEFMLLYFIDMTSVYEYKRKYNEEKMAIAVIMIDNYDDVMNNISDMQKGTASSIIDSELVKWARKHEGILKRVERDKYVFFFENKHLSYSIEMFDVLENVKSAYTFGKMPVTVSIGVGIMGDSLIENESFAYAAIDMALGRGGDQAVIKDGDGFKFFGGNTREYEKSTRVKARVVSHALRELIVASDNVVIMGHKNMDVDAFGAAVGLASCFINDANIKIILGKNTEGINHFVKKIEGKYKDIFVDVLNEEMVTEDTTIIVVDTHKTSIVQQPELLFKTNKIIVIDHHRRDADFIRNTVLIYHEAYASSTSELITEMLPYITGKDFHLEREEAELLFAGIVMDTKNFTFKTGVRTFEAASLLKKYGVDTVGVKKMFQSGKEQYVKKSVLVSEAEIIREGVALSVSYDSSEEGIIIAAQAADDLLGISGILASFVFCVTEDSIIISGRSLGDINVQIILEKMGGGGHQTVAGAQLMHTELSEAKEALVEALSEYYKEKDND